jgi:hypothetical protein
MVYQNSIAAPREELSDIIMEGTTDFSEFQGLALLPARPMRLPTGHVPKISIANGDLLRATRRQRAPGTAFDRWQSAIDDFNITLVQVGEEQNLPDEQTLLYEDYFPIEAFYSMEAANRLRRGHELDVSEAIFNTSNFDAVAAAVAYTTANKATMTPVEDILAAIRRVKARGERPNTVMYPGPVWDRVRTSTEMKDFIVGAINAGAKVTPENLAAALGANGIKQVLIGDGYVNQSEVGSAAVIDQIWPSTYVFVGNCQSGELVSGGIGRTTFWEKEGPLFNMSSYRDERVKSNVVRAQKTSLPTLSNTRAGTLITTNFA